MTVSVSPLNERNTHHLKLSKGGTDVGLILCDPAGNANPRGFARTPIPRSSFKMYSGEQRHSDLEPPWQDVAQDEFSGGRGGEKYEVDTSKYWDGRQVDTTGRGVIIAPMEIWDKGTAVKNHATYWPIYSSQSYTRIPYTQLGYSANVKYIAVRFTANTTFDAKYVYFYARTVIESNTMPVYICLDSFGVPYTVLGSSSATLSPVMSLCVAEFTPAVSLTAGTAYHIVFQGITDYDFILSNDADIGHRTAQNIGGPWSSLDEDKPFFRVEEAGQEFRGHFAELKGVLFCGAEYFDGSVSRVFQCGTGGTATAGAAGYLRDSNNTLITDDAFNGGIIRIMAGTGHHLPTTWRYISDTLTTNREIQITPNWDVAPDTTTEYAIIASDRWFEATGHGMTTQYITDALSTHGAIYFARGPRSVIKRLRYFWSGGTYWQWSDETGQFTFLKKLSDAATTEIWGANRTLPATVSVADAVDCTGTGAAAALSFGAAINVGDLGEKITGMTVYGETTPILYVFKEGSIYKMVNNVPQELRISGMNSAADERNGATSAVNDVYLYFTFLDSVERYYDGSLDDIGPNRDGGLPSNRRGAISAMCSYPGKLYMAIDGGNSNYSSIVAWNGQGYHEVWRAPIAGKRIVGKLYIQPVPGDNVDRLYFTWNGNIMSLSVSTRPYTHNSMGTTEGFQYYVYAPAGAIETGWIHLGLEEIQKLFNAVSIVGENLSSTKSSIRLAYKTDDMTNYVNVSSGSPFTISGDSGEMQLSSSYNVTGRRIRLRLILETNQNNSTPKLDAYVLEGLSTVPHKYETTITFRIEDNAKDLLDEPDDYTTANAKLAQLNTWASEPGVVQVSSFESELHGKYVKLDLASIRVLRHEVMEINHQLKNVYICQATMLEVG